MFHRRTFSLAVAVMLLQFGADAKSVTLEFSGSVLSVRETDGAVTSAGISVGDPVQVSLSYDTATPDWPLYADDLSRGMFVGPGWLKVDINGHRFECTNTIQIDLLRDSNEGLGWFNAMMVSQPTAWPDSLSRNHWPEIYLSFWETAPPYDLLANAELPTEIDFSRADMAEAAIGGGTSSTNRYEIRLSLNQMAVPQAQSDKDWERRYYFATADRPLATPARELKADRNGNLFIAGTLRNTAGNRMKAVVLKYDSRGILQWANTQGSDTDDESSDDMAVHPSGKMCLLTAINKLGFATPETFISSLNSNGTAARRIPLNNPGTIPDHIRVDGVGNVYVGYMGQYGLTVAKYDTNGFTLWQTVAERPDENHGGYTDLEVDNAGNVSIMGAQSFVTRLASDGRILWRQRFVSEPLNEWKEAVDLTLDAKGNAFVTGRSSYQDGNGAIHRCVLTTKYSSKGKPLWNAKYESPTRQEVCGYRMVVDAAGFVYVTGYEGPNVITLKYTPNGRMLWVNRYAKTSWPASIGLDGSGNVFVNGSTQIGTSLLGVSILKIDRNGNRFQELLYHGSTNSFDIPAGFVIGQSNRVSFGVTSYGLTSDLLNVTRNVFIGVSSCEIKDAAGTPSILVQPRERTVPVGGKADFKVTAAGTGTLLYQWFLNGNPIAGATNSTLSINPVTFQSAGAISVEVRNDIGAVASPDVFLTVRPRRW